jgi:hypothetical protein
MVFANSRKATAHVRGKISDVNTPRLEGEVGNIEPGSF